MPEARLTELEIRLAYQEQTINDLNEVVLTQQSEIAELRKAIAKISTRLESEDLSYGSAGERPPHY